MIARITRTSLLSLAMVLLAAGLAACGSASQTTTEPTETATATKSAKGATQPANGSGKAKPTKQQQAKPRGEPKKPAEFKPRVHHDSGGGSGQFEAKGGDNSVQRFGSEPSGGEFDQAAGALHGYLDARAAGAWAAACSYMASGVSKQLSQLSGAGGKAGSSPSCAKIIASLSAGLPPPALREAAVADVGALRVEGERGFLLFHGAHGLDYFMPMVREGGEWKVAALAPSAVG